MGVMRFWNSISGKIFILVLAVTAIVCTVALSALVVVSNRSIKAALARRDAMWAGCITQAVSTVSDVQSPEDLQAAFRRLEQKYGCINGIDIIGADGRVVAAASRSKAAGYGGFSRRSPEGGVAGGDTSADASVQTIIVAMGGDTGAKLRITLLDDFDAGLLYHTRGGFLFIIASSLIVCFVFTYVLVQRHLKRPLRKLLAASCALASNTGDLSAKIDIHSNDELGWLGSTLNEMFAKLSAIIGMIRSTADKVNFSAQSLSAATEQMNSITEETSLTVQNIAKSTDLQAHKVEEMIREIRNMERSVKQVANSAELAASAATNASETATRGGDSAKEAVEKINKIYNQISESAGMIRHLGERSNQIGEIVDVITDVADQTNLLALNAAIEAARAGEAGSGFAVVADEVRKLAEGSAKAAEEIAALIRQTQEDTQNAVRSIELGSKEVTEGKDVITRTGESLDEIVEVLKSSSDMARRISAATKELSRGMKNVITSIDEISGSADKNASATQETAASMEQMTSSMEDVASSAQKLSEMAIQLREHVGRFRISDGYQGTGASAG